MTGRGRTTNGVRHDSGVNAVGTAGAMAPRGLAGNQYAVLYDEEDEFGPDGPH